MVLVNYGQLRPKSISPIYPPYHQGEYLEEYFYRRWNEENIKSNREYLDIFWTNIFCNSAFAGTSSPDVQSILNQSCVSSGKYFTVCQFDDGPFEKFPDDTLIFSAGGNREGPGIVPIPLICSSIPSFYIQPKEKTIFSSFIGSRTHFIRNDMCKYLRGKSEYILDSGSWTPNVQMSNFEKFVDITSSSKFGLAPRGYGKSSFRLYEIMQLGAVPVYISDDFYLPWSDELEWSDFCVLIDEDNLRDIDSILKSISDSEYQTLLENGKKVYNEYFTLEGMFQNIIKRL